MARGQVCLSSNWDLTTAPECSQKAALGSHSGASRSVVQNLKNLASRIVLIAAHNAQSTLAHSRNHHVVIEYLSNPLLMTKTFQSSNSENDPIEIAPCKSSQARVDIATQNDEIQSGEAVA